MVPSIPERFEEKGGEFVSSPFSIRERLSHIRALVFDWDGVFHSGYKNENRTSSFSEADSMGVNMLRFGLYLENGILPYTAIISGENNPTATHWATREHLDAVHLGVKHKVEILDKLTEQGIQPEEILFVFDDILDLSLANRVGLRFLISRPASHAFAHLCKERHWCDYISAYSGAEHGVREVCELSLNILGNWETVIEERVAFSEKYQAYLAARNTIKTA